MSKCHLLASESFVFMQLQACPHNYRMSLSCWGWPRLFSIWLVREGCILWTGLCMWGCGCGRMWMKLIWEDKFTLQKSVSLYILIWESRLGFILKFCFHSRLQKLCVLSMSIEEGRGMVLWKWLSFPFNPLLWECIWFASQKLCLAYDRWGVSVSHFDDIATSIGQKSVGRERDSMWANWTFSPGSRSGARAGSAQQETGLALSKLLWLVFTRWVNRHGSSLLSLSWFFIWETLIPNPLFVYDAF